VAVAQLFDGGRRLFILERGKHARVPLPTGLGATRKREEKLPRKKEDKPVCESRKKRKKGLRQGGEETGLRLPSRVKGEGKKKVKKEVIQKKKVA